MLHLKSTFVRFQATMHVALLSVAFGKNSLIPRSSHVPKPICSVRAFLPTSLRMAGRCNRCNSVLHCRSSEQGWKLSSKFSRKHSSFTPDMKRDADASGLGSGVGSAIYLPISPLKDVINTNEIQNMCDLENPEYHSFPTPILITPSMKSCYNKLAAVRASPQDFKVVYQGPSGCGKSMTLMVTGHIARKSGWLVFPLAAGTFTGLSQSKLARRIKFFLDKWKDASGEESLRELKLPGNVSILELVNDALLQEGDYWIISKFVGLVLNLRRTRTVPILFLIDQCNAFAEEHSRITESLLRESEKHSIHREWADLVTELLDRNTFTVLFGGILYAYSTAFRLSPAENNANLALITRQGYLNPARFAQLVDLLFAAGSLPASCKAYLSEFYIHCGGSPRSARTFGQCAEEDSECTKDYFALEEKHSMFLKDDFAARIDSLLERIRSGEPSNPENWIFACRLLAGDKMREIPWLWRQSNLVIFKDGFYCLPCQAANDALVHSFARGDNILQAVRVVRDEPIIMMADISWRALEIEFIHLLHMARISGKDVTLRCSDLAGRYPQDIIVRINRIIRCDVEPAPSSIERGTVFILSRSHQLADFFVYSLDGSKSFIHVSETPYAERDSQPSEAQKAVFDKFHSACKSGDGVSIRYIYITTSKILSPVGAEVQKPSAAYHHSDVLLLSVAEGQTSKLFKKSWGK